MKISYPNIEHGNLQYIKHTLFDSLGELVNTPRGRMRLTELYSNGNVGCVPITCIDYKKEISEFHSLSVTPIIE